MTRLVIATLLGLTLAQFATLITTVYLHRGLSHRALTVSPAVGGACRFLLWITTGIRPRQWVAVHRKHHAFTDVEGDPHSPLLEGYPRVQFNNVGLYRRVARDPAAVSRYARDIAVDGWDRALFDHALVGLGLGIAALVILFGPWFTLVAAGVHTAAYLLLNAAINAIGHMWGRQPYDNRARNNQWLALITSGEGLHNNHHAAPTSATLALHPGEIDPASWLIRALERRGWATVRHHEVKLKTGAAV